MTNAATRDEPDESGSGKYMTRVMSPDSKVANHYPADNKLLRASDQRKHKF